MNGDNSNRFYVIGKLNIRPIVLILHYLNGSGVICILKVMGYFYPHYKISGNLCMVKRAPH